jgi:hypothetical protein
MEDTVSEMLCSLECWAMGKVQKFNNAECYTLSSERLELRMIQTPSPCSLTTISDDEDKVKPSVSWFLTQF